MYTHLPGRLFSGNCPGLKNPSLVDPSLAIYSLRISVLGTAALSNVLAERSCT